MAAAGILATLGPVIATVAGGLVTLAVEPFLTAPRKQVLLPWLGVAAVAVAFLVLLLDPPAAVRQLGDLFTLDATRGWLSAAVLASALAGLVGVQQSATRDGSVAGEPYALILLAAAGAQLMVLATSLIALFIGLELASIAIYALVGSHRRDHASGEGMLKYLVMGACFSAVFLYGVALVYGASGSFVYGAAPLPGREILLLLGHALIIVGLLFKVGAVPFHFWSPDAYAGAPMAVTGFMAGAMKIGGFTALGALWLHLVSPEPVLDLGRAYLIDPKLGAADNPLPVGALTRILAGVAVLSLLIGSFSALGQRRLRRLIAFSSVANAGYLLLAFALPTDLALRGSLDLSGLWVYLVGYAVANSALLALFAGACGDDDDDAIDDLAGFARRHPIAGSLATLLLASLAGLPPAVGFLGKYLVLSELVAKGQLVLAVFAIAMAAVGAVYYVRLIAQLWSGSEHGEEDADADQGAGLARPMGLAYGVAALATLAVVALLVWPPLARAVSVPPAEVVTTEAVTP